MFRSTSLVHIFDCVVLVRSESTVTYTGNVLKAAS
jgi:hypothetical protein